MRGLVCFFAASLLAMASFGPYQDAEENQSESARPEEIANSIGMRLRLIPAGEFMMGAVPDDREAESSEKPQHRVEITKPFYLGVCEVTQEEWQRVMENRPSSFQGSTRPVESVSWEDAVAFCEVLSTTEGVTYRLPTEAEWEYACRSATTTRYYWGGDMDDDFAWHDENSGGETHPTAQKQPNAWGMHDMSGNVWEWCGDWFDENYYRQSPAQDPEGPAAGMSRVVRGGSWYNYPKNLRSSSRFGFRPDKGNYYIGFRVAREVN